LLFLQKLPQLDFFFASSFLLCPEIKEKSAFAPTSIEKADPVNRIG
jgi:hypothetical protein